MFFIPSAAFIVVMQKKSDLDCIAHVTLLKFLLIFPGLVCLYHFMPIRIFANVTLKYWHLHTNILVIFTLLPFIVVIIEIITLEQLYLAAPTDKTI